MNITLRQISILCFLICAAVLVGAVYIEENFLVAPCPLCMLQRFVYGAMACVFLIGSIFTFKSISRYVYSITILIFASLGFSIASYQFWLQYFAPPQKISCSASLTRLIELHPFLDALKMAFAGSPECARIDFTIFTISIAGWSVILFGIFVILTLYVIRLQKNRWI